MHVGHCPAWPLLQKLAISEWCFGILHAQMYNLQLYTYTNSMENGNCHSNIITSTLQINVMWLLLTCVWVNDSDEVWCAGQHWPLHLLPAADIKASGYVVLILGLHWQLIASKAVQSFNEYLNSGEPCTAYTVNTNNLRTRYKGEIIHCYHFYGSTFPVKSTAPFCWVVTVSITLVCCVLALMMARPSCHAWLIVNNIDFSNISL